MKSYFKFILPYKKAFILSPLLVLVDVFCEIVQPEMMSKIVDTGILHKDLPYIMRTGSYMVGLPLVAIIANIGNIWYSSEGSVGLVSGLRKSLFRPQQRRPDLHCNKNLLHCGSYHARYAARDECIHRSHRMAGRQ